MQQLLKEFKQYINESYNKAVMLHNMQFLVSLKNNSIGINLDKLSKKEAFHIVSSVPPLQDFKITKNLGHGAFGTTYLLENGHALKLFHGGYDDYKRYKIYIERTFSGEGSQEDFAIFDKGEFEMKFQVMNYKGEMVNQLSDIYWVEMPEIIPLESWLKRTGRPADKIAKDGMPRFYQIYGNIYLSYKYGDEIKEGDIEPLTMEEAEGIKKAMKHYEEVIAPLDDAHAGNIGVYPHNPSIWAIFDN
tara:strand:+ start:388 stop:1125 length:738 start_codon:yes stop_codon:yes gene_type:complete